MLKVAEQLGPLQHPRSIEAEPFLETLLREGRAAGVTRLASVTGLDRIGFPVWQAVRPAGRAQSVHQGKGWCDRDARIGALGEALESHCAERVPADGPRACWADLPLSRRCQDPRDFYSDRKMEDPGAIDWCITADLRTGDPIFLPHLSVSLDFTLPDIPAIERSSSGLATGTCEAEAIETALLELLERDAVGTFNRLPASQKAARRVDLGSIPFAWFHGWAGRVRAAGADLRVFGLEALTGIPVCIVYLSGREAFGPSRRLFMGSAAHGSPEVALFKAMAEALQSRLTFIAGSRDDMLPSFYLPVQPGSLLGAAGLVAKRLDFAALQPVQTDPWVVAERLAALGYPILALKRLDPPGSPVPAVKVFVPGLGSLTRSRRTVS